MIFRTPKFEQFSIVSNYHLTDKNLSLKAKGLLTLILSLPDDWDYSLDGLVKLCKEGYESVKNTVNELKEFGYIEVVKLLPNQTKSGRIEYEYIVYEESTKTRGQNQGLVFQGLENQGLENPRQQNTNKLSTNKQSTNNIPPISSPGGAQLKRTRRRDNLGSFDTDDFFNAALERSYRKS